MRNNLQKIISKEDFKQPLTDTELCRQLSVTREYVTQLRKELGILDSRERKKTYVCKEIKKALDDTVGMSVQELLKALQAKGYPLSKYLLDKYLDELGLTKLRKDTVLVQTATNESKPQETQYQAFRKLVGHDGSLDMQIQQAKATILYPPNGLHSLILGETGVGKSELAEAMYRFALESGCLSQESPFVVFNCADYAENTQLLMTQLFGCLKGAYTGAVNDRKGLVEQADGGILFLDEVHRLSSEGQEMLFQLIDKGVFRRLGESESTRTAKVQLVAATTENIETSLLSTFKRRIPMLIHIPSLTERPLSERLLLIRRFFSDESVRMDAPLHVALDVITAYLLYDCKGNIGQLKSDIQVACAKSFLTYVTTRSDTVNIDIHDLNLHVKKGLMKINSRRQELDTLIWTDLRFHPANCQEPSPIASDVYSFPKEFYATIEKTYTDYREQGLDGNEINQLIGEEIEKKLQKVISHVRHHFAPLSTEEFAKVVGTDVIEIVEDILKIAEMELGSLDKSLSYCLAIHLNATFIRLDQGKQIINPNKESIKEKSPLEYATAEKMVKRMQAIRGIILPEDEIGYIALYLSGGTQAEECRPGIIVATHGNAGTHMLEIASKLLNISHGQSFAMRFEENPQEALERLTLLAESCDEGKGVLLLVDMGSLLTFGELIQERTRIPIATISRVDTVMVIEALRRSILPGTNLSDIVDGIEALNYTFPKTNHTRKPTVRQKAIITVCFTGEGIALYCRQQVRKLLGKDLNDVALLHMGIVGKQEIYKQVQQAMQQYEIIAITGSVDPKLYGIPYIPMNEILSDAGAARLQSLLRPEAVLTSIPEAIPDIIRSAKFCRFDSEHYAKEAILHQMCEELVRDGFVTPDYESAVWEREAMGSYLIAQKVALPHADSRYVNTPIIFIAKTQYPVLWDGVNETNLICLLALDIDGKDGVRYLYKKFQNKSVIAHLETAVTEDDMRRVLLNGTD